MSRSSGFTLIELLVVIILVGALVYIAVPRIKSGTQINIKTASRNLSGTIKYLYSESAFKKNIYRLVFDVENDEYWVEYLDYNEYVKSPDPNLRKRKLPKGVHFKDVITERAQSQSTLDDSIEFIIFLPTGFVEPAVIHLETDNEDYYTLQTKPYTGGTRVYNEYVELMRSN